MLLNGFLLVICENDMLRDGNSGLKNGSLARHIPNMHTYGSTLSPPPPPDYNYSNHDVYVIYIFHISYFYVSVHTSFYHVYIPGVVLAR